jgi:hypothetical protein
MALTHELNRKDSPVRRWFEHWLPNANPISQDWNTRVKGAATLRPETDLRVPGAVGTAFDYRARYYLAITPFEDMVAATGLRLLDASRTRTRTNRAADAFLDLYGPPPPEAAGIVALITDFQNGLATTLAELAPVRRELSEDDEQLLCRYCYVLGLLEELYRAGLKIKSPLFTLSPRATLDDLLALPPPIWVDDLCALSRAFAPTVPEFAREPLVLNPIFAGSGDIGGANADLVSVGCLVDIKTTVDPKFTRTRLLYQLLGYVFLDYDDVYAINSAGVYLSRQAILIRWPLESLLTTLLDGKDASLAELRDSFRIAVAAAKASATSLPLA